MWWTMSIVNLSLCFLTACISCSGDVDESTLSMRRVSTLIGNLLSTDPGIAIDAAEELSSKWQKKIKKVVSNGGPSGDQLLTILSVTLSRRATLEAAGRVLPPAVPSCTANDRIPTDLIVELMGVIGKPALRQIDRSLIMIRENLGSKFSDENKMFFEFNVKLERILSGYRAEVVSMQEI